MSFYEAAYMNSEIHKPSIYAKASLDMGEIQEKIRCGCDAIELNLEADFLLYGNDFLGHYGSEIFAAKDIRVVHVPFNQDGEMLNLEWIFGHRDISVLRDVFSLAQYCGDKWGHDVTVVVHFCMAMYDFMQYELLQERIVENLKALFHQYPRVELAVENGVPLELGKAGQFIPRLCNGNYRDTSEIVRWLRERLGDRVGSVLDTCHAMMTEKYMKTLLRAADIAEMYPVQVVNDINMEHFFQMNQEICKLIHFNNLYGNGYRENHGVPFEKFDEVTGLLALYEKYRYQCPLTLEIREEDYLDCKNYRKTMRLIEEAFAVAGVQKR